MYYIIIIWMHTPATYEEGEKGRSEHAITVYDRQALLLLQKWNHNKHFKHSYITYFYEQGIA